MTRKLHQATISSPARGTSQRLGTRLVGLCGHVTVSLICWALWSCDCQSDMLGFVGAILSCDVKCVMLQHASS